MIISCPHCRTKLKLPEEVEGKQVRCPSCKVVFVANPEELQDAVQPGLPGSAPTSVTNPPPIPASSADDDAGQGYPIGKSRAADHDDEDDAPPRRRRYSDDEDDRDDDEPRRRIERDDDLYASARGKTRIAGIAMMAAALFVLLNVAVNAVLSQVAQGQVGAPPVAAQNPAAFRIGQIVGVFCLALIFLPMIGFTFWAGVCLVKLGSRGIIITGIVMNGLLLLILGGGLGLNLYVLMEGAMPVPIGLVLPTVVMNSISCLLNLAAAALTIIALVQRDVSEFYAMQSGAARRRRR